LVRGKWRTTRKFKAIAVIGLLVSAPAFAEEDKEAAPQLRERISCFPAKGITKFVSKFQKIDAKKRDTVDMLFSAKFSVKDGGVMPERLFIRDDGAEDNFALKPDGEVTDFDKIGVASDAAEICTDDPSREGTPRGSGFSFSITNDVHFLDNDGYHELAAIKEGLKDGKTHYKKMAPAPIRMLIPSLSHVMIEYEAEDVVPQYAALKGETPIEGLEHELFCGQALIKLKDLEQLGADGLKIMGGVYNLTPVPGPKALARFVDCGEDEDTKAASADTAEE